MNPKTFAPVCLSILLMFAPALAMAAKTTYVFTNRKFNFIKRTELSKKILKKRGEIVHPYTFTALQLRKMLEPITVHQKLFFSKEVVEREVFNANTLDWLVPHLANAFKDAKIGEEVIFSFVVPSKKFLIRDDRLTIVHSWVSGGKWHLHFKKLMAKIPNTYDQRGDIHKAMNEAQSVRISLELAKGQEFGASTEELQIVIPSVESLAQVELSEPKEEPKPATSFDAVPAAKPEVKAQAPASDLELRLQELKALKEKGLISNKEYKEKRQEILKDL